MRKRLWMLLVLLVCVSGEYLMGGHLDNNAGSTTRSGKIDSSSVLGRKTRLDDLDLDLVAAESTVAVGTEISTGVDGVPRYHIPPFAFNGGKPFSLEKDPITGKIDFEKAPPVKALNYTGRYREREDKESKDDDDNRGAEGSVYARQEKIRNKDRNGPNEITPNFHDFLNLPVHYSSDKYGNDKYPLISNSYANTKVQSGTNSYSTYNHRHSESDLYVHPVKSYPSTKTSTYRTTIVNDLKTKETSTTSPSMTFASPTNSALPTSTKTPVVTTWKPFNTAITFHPIDRFEAENEKNLLPIEKLHASTHTGSHRNSSDISTKSPSKGTTDKAPVTSRYKDQSNLDNLVVAHETKPQNEEHKESYDIYESNGESVDNNEDNYSYLWLDLLKEDDTSTPSTTTSSTTTPMTTVSTISTVPKSSAEITTSTTVAPLRSVSSTLSTIQKDVPANKPLQFPTVSHHPISSSSPFNRYRPNPIIKFNDEPNRMGAPVIESTSNIVIPPDQNTVSFVLGNRQNVDGGYYSVGTVGAVGENLYGGSSETNIFWPLRNDPHNPSKEVKHEHLPISVTELNPERVTQKWSSPSPLKSSNEISPTRPQSPLLAVTVIQDTKNASKDSGYVIFPEEEQTKNKNTLKEEHTVIINEADGSVHELPPKITLTTSTSMNKTKFNPPANVIENMPQLAEDLMPPAESTRSPSNYYYYQFEPPRPNQVRPQRLPLPPRIKPHLGPVPPMDMGVRKRPYPADTKLPNILPQFRPNAKASHGHRSPDVIGTMAAGQSVPTRIRQPLPVHPSRRPLPLPPLSHLQRLNPPPPPIHAVKLAFTPKVDGAILSHEMDPTIRRLRPPVLPGIPNSISRLEENASSNRLLPHGDDGEGGESRNEDRSKSEIADERESERPEKYPEEPPMTPPRPPLFPKRRTADPPRVTTLQMIQHHGEFGDEGDEVQLAQPVEPVLAHEAERRKSDNHDPSEIPEQPVYVVYPVNTAVNIHSDDSNEKDGSVVVGTRGPQRPLPPDTLLQNEQDDTHTVYSGRPVALDFPYPLERPDPSSVFPVGVKETPVLIPSEQRQQQQQVSAAIANERENEKNDAVNVIPYLQDFSPYRKKNDAAISVTLHRIPSIVTSSSSLISTTSTSTSTPIAYVYTPTHAPHPAHLDKGFDVDDDAATSIDAKQTELLPSQQPSSSSSSAPAPQNFMAPFVASMSAETPSKNGWSVVVVEPPAGAEKKSDSGSAEEKLADSENDMQTERNEFDADNFKPQLFGGFKPLYEFPTEDVERHDVADMDTETNISRHSKKMLPVPDRE